MKRVATFLGTLGVATLILLTPTPADAGWKNFGLGSPAPGNSSSDEYPYDLDLPTVENLLDSIVDDSLPQAPAFVDAPVDAYADVGTQVAQVPEPGTLALLVLALAGLAWGARSKVERR